jgi:4-diphosphocytidyl-2-C-methyl-D-erythritol kinase
VSGPITIVSPAKVNLHLAVGPARPDGYHDLVTVFQALTLADTVTIERADTLSLESDVELGVPAVDNLAVRAARALGDEMGREPSVRIGLSKSIPAGAGLGGGSSNAAAVIAGLAHMWGIESEDHRLIDAAASIGADVPFFLHGGTGLYHGRGDELDAWLPTPTMHLVVVWPREPVSTAEAYQAVDADPGREPAPSVDALIDALNACDPAAVAGALCNDFTSYSAYMVEGIADALAWLEGSQGVLGAAMAGSGSAVFGICASAEVARSLAGAADAHGWWAAACDSSDRGVHVPEQTRRVGGRGNE